MVNVESVADKISRLENMASGEPSWDLSTHDMEAIQWALDEIRARQDVADGIKTSPNSSSPKLPDFTIVYDKVKEWFDSAPDFARPCPADIAKVTYDIIAGNFGR